MKNKGVTMPELIIVLAITAIIATFTIINVTTVQTRTKIKADTHNVVMLNQMTQDYSLFSSSTNGDLFFGIDEDSARIQTLVDEGFITAAPKVAQKGASYIWDVDGQYWTLEGGELDFVTSTEGSTYDFSIDFKEALTEAGVVFRNENKWNDEDGYLENDPGEQLLFVPIGKTNYTITVSASLSTGSNGGYGVMFDTILVDGNENKDTGLILQFDRGYARGSMIVRPRTNGRESGAVWQLRGSNTDLFPSTSQDADWWSETHTIKITVESSGGNDREATFFIDGVEIGSYSYTKDISEDVIYTGFRTWSNPTTKFYSISVN